MNIPRSGNGDGRLVNDSIDAIVGPNSGVHRDAIPVILGLDAGLRKTSDSESAASARNGREVAGVGNILNAIANLRDIVDGGNGDATLAVVCAACSTRR